MKGDTVEVINTDAEGRLVLADVLWYAQDRFKPAAIVDLATLTGAIIIALGHEKAGVFANDDALAGAFLAAAEAEGEGAWRMPLAPAYDKLLKSRIADIANVGGRPAGSVTAAQFLQRFVKAGTPWIHLDIAGVAYVAKDGELGAEGRDRLGRARRSTGWCATVSRAERADGGGALLPPQRHADRGEPAADARDGARARLAGRRALRLGGRDGDARRGALDLAGRRLPAARHRRGRACGRAAGLSDARRGEPERRDGADAGRRRRGRRRRRWRGSSGPA